MVEIKEEDIIVDNIEEYFFYLRSRYILSPSKVQQLKQQILQDHELRKEIVDLADIWDGKESEKNISKITKEITQKILDEKQ